MYRSLLSPTITVSDTSSFNYELVFFLLMGIAAIAFTIAGIALLAQCGRANAGNAAEPRRTHPVLGAFFLVFGIIGAIASFFLVRNSFPDHSESGGSSSPQLFSRKANNSDITVQDTQLNWSSMGQDIIIIAKSDIKGLTLQFKFYDKNDKLLSTKTKNLGTVTKGGQYTVTFGVSDLSLSTSMNSTYFSVSVSGGTVSYFQ